MKRHIEGTNNRTFCGNRINAKTILMAKGVPEFMSDCDRCLGRLTDDSTLMVQFMNLLHVVCKDATTLHHVTRLHNQQLKQNRIKKQQQLKEYRNGQS
jgi:hypothetical protein